MCTMNNDPFKRLSQKIARHPMNTHLSARGYQPIFHASKTSHIVIIGQAPGRIAQESGISWNDKSGDTLRSWLSLSREEFYDASTIALIPMDFYFPGKGIRNDLPPRPHFAPLWHPKIFALLPPHTLTILVGSYSQAYYLKQKEKTLTETVRNYKAYMRDNFFPIPHPSPRNILWHKKNPWFLEEVVPALQKSVQKALTRDLS